MEQPVMAVTPYEADPNLPDAYIDAVVLSGPSQVGETVWKLARELQAIRRVLRALHGIASGGSDD